MDTNLGRVNEAILKIEAEVSTPNRLFARPSAYSENSENASVKTATTEPLVLVNGMNAHGSASEPVIRSIDELYSATLLGTS